MKRTLFINVVTNILQYFGILEYSGQIYTLLNILIGAKSYLSTIIKILFIIRFLRILLNP